MPHPTDYSRRILVAVSGLSPQIVTETLYGLLQQDPPFIPTEIHLLTTEVGVENVDLELLHSETGKFHQFCRDYQITPPVFSLENVHVISDPESGIRLQDIRTPSQNEAAADQISGLISELSKDENAAIHASIAGGRKTMGYYLGYALSLFGREQDRLSHVLVTEGYEGLPQFFYPTLKSHVIHAEGRRPLDSKKAEVVLALIPFVRLRTNIPHHLLSGKAGFSETVRMARLAEQPLHLYIDRHERQVVASEQVVPMKDIDFTFYLWMLQLNLNQGTIPIPRSNRPNQDYADQFMEIYDHLVFKHRGVERTRSGFENKKGMTNRYFNERISRIKDSFIDALGESLASKYLINKISGHDPAQYAIQLDGDQVEIV